MTPRLERAIQRADDMSAGLERAAEDRRQMPDFLSHTDTTPTRTRRHGIGQRLISSIPTATLLASAGALALTALNGEGSHSSQSGETAKVSTAIGVPSESIFDAPATTHRTEAPATVVLGSVDLVAASSPLAAPILAKKEPQKPGEVITAQEITDAISAGVLVETDLQTESLQDKKGNVITPKKGDKPQTKQVRTIWDAYAKDLGTKLNKKATRAQLNVDSRLSDRITTAYYAHNQDPKKQRFNDTAMTKDTKYLALTDNAQLITAALLKIDVKALEANKNIPTSVIETVKALQKMNAQPAETKKTRSSIEQQNLLAADKSLAIFTKLKVAYTKPEFKAFIDKLLADYTATNAKGKNQLSDNAFQEAVQIFFARTAVKTALT